MHLPCLPVREGNLREGGKIYYMSVNVHASMCTMYQCVRAYECVHVRACVCMCDRSDGFSKFYHSFLYSLGTLGND